MCGSAAVPNIMQNTMPEEVAPRDVARRFVLARVRLGVRARRGGVGRQVGAPAKKPAALAGSDGQ
jgi:hypothetical protein